jgi:PAS domain S-box-containing protein
MEGFSSHQFSDLNDLRQEALRRLGQQPTGPQPIPEADGADPQRLLHELQVRQLELEMQNEELMAARQVQEASHYRYARYYDQAPVAYFNLNARGLIGRCNVAASRLLGYERRYLPGCGMLTLVCADDQAAFFTFFNHLAAGAPARPCQVRLRGKNVLTGPVRLEGSRLEDEDGNPEYLVAAIALDGPEQTPAEHTAPERLLREAEAVGGTGSYEADLATMQFRFSDNLYRLLGQEPQSFVPTLDWIDSVCFELDGNFTIRYANRRALQAWGKPAEEVTGRKMWEVHPGYWNTAVSDALLKAFREGRQVHEEIWSPVGQRWMLLNANPSPAGLIVLHFDVTDRKRAEAALQENRELLQSVFEATPNAISVFKAVRDEAGRIVDFEWLLAGPLLVRNFAGGQELVGKRYRQVFASEKAGGIMDRLVEVVETGRSADFEVQYQRQGDDTGCMRIIVVKLDDGVVATSEDVTARRQAEEQLRKHLTILQQSEELAGTGSWEYDVSTGQFTWSEGMYRLFGLDKARPVTPEIYAAYAVAADQPVAEKRIGSLRTNPQPFEEILRIRKDGQVRMLKIKTVVTRTPERQPAKVLGVHLDITAIAAAEVQLEENRALLHAVIEAAPVAIAVHRAIRDEGGRITDFRYQFVNRETERQAGNRPLAGKPYRETLPGPRAAKWFGQFVRVVEENVPLRTERCYPVDGADHWYLVSAVKLGDGLVVISQDVTDRKRMEAENLALTLLQQKAILDAQEEERRRISESLHNGVGQVLYATKLNLDRVDLDLLPGQAAEVNEALETTGQLLAEAIRETRRVSHELVPVLLHDFGLETAVDEFCKRFTGTGLHLTCRVANLDGRLDPHLEVALYRISQELILNVVKHAGADRASLLLEKQAGEIVLEVNDNGKGLRPDKVLPKGMGLRTIRDRVKLLNGTVEFASSPGGVRATIRIPLPEKE